MGKTRRETNRGFSLSDTTAMSMANSTTETTIFSETIPANRMGTTKELTLRLLCTLTSASLSVPALTIRLKLGTGTLVLLSAGGLAVSASNKPFVIEALIANKDSTASQVVMGKISQNAASTPLLLSGGSTAMETADWTQDTTSDLVLAVTAQFSGLSAGTALAVKHASLDLS